MTPSTTEPLRRPSRRSCARPPRSQRWSPRARRSEVRGPRPWRGRQPGVGPRLDLRLGGSRGGVRAFGVQDERLDRQAVDLGVEPADERPDGAPGEPLDRLAELAHGRILEEYARVAQPLVLAERGE